VINIVLEATKRIYGLEEEQKNFIMEQLTLANPKYLMAKQHSNNPNITVDKYVFCYTDKSTYLDVPVGYNIPFEHSIEDKRKSVRVPYTYFKLDLRETQQLAYEEYLKNTDKGVIVLPTGKGKSILGMYIAYKLRQKTLVIVHKDDLVDGWTQDSKICFGEKFKIGLIKASKRKVGKQITISTVQTLSRMGEKELQKYLNMFGLIIIDEAHHTPANTYHFINKANCRYKIGLTATDERDDGLRELLTYYIGDVSYRFISDENDEDIFPVEVFVEECPVKYVPLVVEQYNKDDELYYKLYDPKKHKNLVPIEITRVPHEERPRVFYHTIDNMAVTDMITMHKVCSLIKKEYVKNHSIVVFFTQKEHCRLYREFLIDMFCVREDKIQLYYGDAKESKAEMKIKAESKEVLITLATYSIATEGTNVKAWEVAFLVSSINNEKNTEQASGRIRRAKEGKINPVRLYDFRYPNVYTLDKHGFTRDRRYKKLKFKKVGSKLPISTSLFTRGFDRK
jgi:superfamily II DNA or RNA helicase